MPSLLYLASLEPLSLISTGNLDPGHLLSTLGTRAVGYVSSSPKQLQELFSSPANRMFIDDNQVGQTFNLLANLDNDMLTKILPSHGFPAESFHLLGKDNRAGLIRARLNTLIAGEREFLRSRNVGLPTEQTTDIIADSDASDDEY